MAWQRLAPPNESPALLRFHWIERVAALARLAAPYSAAEFLLRRKPRQGRFPRGNAEKRGSIRPPGFDYSGRGASHLGSLRRRDRISTGRDHCGPRTSRKPDAGG